jgi:glycosyltransferase involved in cell wall biosynthesis
MSTVSKNYSAVLTTYNAEKTVVRAIESILRQAYPPDDIIIVDDCSTDNTISIIESLQIQDLPVKTFVNVSNLGQSWGRNFAAQQSKAEFLVFFDDDDCSLSERSTIHLEHFSNGVEISYVSSVKNYSVDYEVRNVNQDLSFKEIDFEDAFKLIFLGTPITPLHKVYVPSSTLAVSKSAFLRLKGFDATIRRLEDMDFFLRAVQERMQISWSDRVGVVRFHSTGFDKGSGQDSIYEEILIERYGRYVPNEVYTRAVAVSKLRSLYFTRNYSQFFSFLIRNPSILLLAFSKCATLRNRLRHERSVRGGS